MRTHFSPRGFQDLHLDNLLHMYAVLPFEEKIMQVVHL